VKRVAFIGLGRMGQPMAANLAREGLADRSSQVGDVMLDAIRAFAPVALARA